jgi:ribosome-binding protein aMBF1 (putative translation factor)
VEGQQELSERWQEESSFRSRRARREGDFTLFDELVRARQQAQLSQCEVAERMGTKAPAIARLEAGGGRKGHSPSVSTLQRYAEAVGCQLEIRLVRR